MRQQLTISRRHAVAIVAAAAAASCTSRAASAGKVRRNLYACDGCEAATERPVGELASSARIGASDEPGEPLVLEGRVVRPDGVTPAPGVVIYAHHTDANGIYRGGRAEAAGSARHGVLHGWAATDADGRYRFDTIKPAPYPSRTLPAHIHLYIVEPGRPPYYIDDVVFAGEFGVDARYRARQELRGGSGITRLARSAGGVWLARRNITLERHP